MVITLCGCSGTWVWQKDYPSTFNFLSALHANYYEGIAIIFSLIFYDEGECRGYITPWMVDRTFNRVAWESFGFILEKGIIGAFTGGILALVLGGVAMAKRKKSATVEDAADEDAC